jgi:hypothetical protein
MSSATSPISSALNRFAKCSTSFSSLERSSMSSARPRG